MGSLLDLDQILIDKDKQRERIKFLYGQLNLMYQLIVKYGKTATDETLKKYQEYTEELRSYGCDV